MQRLPKDPLTPATRSQVIVAGVASLITAIAFIIFAAVTTQMTFASGRIRLPSVMLLIAFMLVISLGFFDVTVAIFRKRRLYLLSSTTLYLIGSFLFILPLGMLGWSLMKESPEDTLSVLKVLSLSSLGLLTIRLAHIRRKRALNAP
ncbi:MAG TPA: hypothetical protein VHD61_07180 [Lacunisphaera sp.]|nr:hypothetical protein [Lacunisphaera sp.]